MQCPIKHNPSAQPRRDPANAGCSLRISGMLEAADCTATPREGSASILHPPASSSWTLGQRCPGRGCLGSCNVQVHGLWALETVWGGGGVRRSLVWLHAW